MTERENPAVSLYNHGMAWADSHGDQGFDPIKEKYVRLDLERWLKQHGVVKKAKSQGQKNKPSSDSSSLDGNELQIVDWINHRGRKCREDVVGHISDFERELAVMENDAELTALQHRVHQIEKNAEIALERKVIDGHNRLTRLGEEVVEARQDFHSFKAQSKLTRPPEYSHRSTFWWFIVACVSLEIILNASLLMDVIPSGLLGAIFQMVLISSVNVFLCGFPMGGFLRLRNHVQWSKTTVSWIGMTSITLFALIFNLAVGHFRDSVQLVLTDRSADVFQIGADALRRLTDDPFGLESFHTALLVLLGLACFGFSSWKRLQYDDSYPGYGDRHRQIKQLEDDYLRIYNKIQSELDGLYQGFEAKLEDIRHRLQTKQSKWREICGRGMRLVNEYSVNLGQYQHDLDYLLKAYRTANETVRTNPSPSYFERLEAVDSAILEAPSFTPPTEIDIQGVIERVHATISQLQVWFRKSCRKIRSVHNI